MSCSTPIITNQEFRARWVLLGLEREEEQFKISSNATVEVRIKSADGKTAYFPWRTLSYDANTDDNWSLSTLDIIIAAADTALVTNASSAEIDVRVQGFFVGRDGINTANTYDKTWTQLYSVETGLA